MEQDIRWKQRFGNYEKALKQLTSALEEFGNDPMNIIKEGIIQCFEFTHELAKFRLYSVYLYKAI